MTTTIGTVNFSSCTTNDVVLIVASIAIFSAILYFVIKYFFAAQYYPDEEQLINYRSDIVNDMLQHIMYWYNLPKEVFEDGANPTTTPEDQTIIPIIHQDMEITLTFNWAKKIMTYQYNHYLHFNGQYYHESKKFSFKNDVMPYEKICAFIQKINLEVDYIMGYNYEGMIQDIAAVSRANAEREFTDDEYTYMLIAAATEFLNSNRIQPEMLERDRDYMLACTRLMSYITKYHYNDFIEHLKKQVAKNSNDNNTNNNEGDEIPDESNS